MDFPLSFNLWHIERTIEILFGVDFQMHVFLCYFSKYMEPVLWNAVYFLISVGIDSAMQSASRLRITSENMEKKKSD